MIMSPIPSSFHIIVPIFQVTCLFLLASYLRPYNPLSYGYLAPHSGSSMLGIWGPSTDGFQWMDSLNNLSRRFYLNG